MVRYGSATAAAVMILLLVGLAPAGSSQVPWAPQAGSIACAGAGGLLSFDPPVTNTLGVGVVKATFSVDCVCLPTPDCPPVVEFEGTYRGDCTETLIKAPNLPGDIHLWGGRVLQATGAIVVVPDWASALDFLAILGPDGACNQASAGVLATTGAFVLVCRPEPGSDGCG